mgnify:CR=1 FL=1
MNMINAESEPKQVAQQEKIEQAKLGELYEKRFNQFQGRTMNFGLQRVNQQNDLTFYGLNSLSEHLQCNHDNLQVDERSKE